MNQDDEIVRHNAAKLIETLEKLNNETRRLRGDVVKLYDRIMPYEGEPLRPVAQFDDPLKTVQQAFDAIAAARHDISQAEYDLNFIRGQVDQLMSGGWSRDEMKQWIKDPKAKS